MKIIPTEKFESSQMYSFDELLRKNNTNIKITATTPYVNYYWINEYIEDILHKNYPFLKKHEFELNISQQELPGKITKVIACLKDIKNFTFITGEGLDEYEAVKNMMNNLDLEVRLNALKNMKRQKIISNALNDANGGEEYA